MSASRKAKRALVLAAAVSAAISGGTPFAFSAPDNYTGTASNNWDTAGNWDLGHKPTPSDDAILALAFPATGRFITLSAGETANSLTFNNQYMLQGGDLTLTTGNILVDPGPFGVSTDGAAYGATITSDLLGNAGLNKSGAGTLFASGVNTFTGTVNVTGGKLAIIGDTSLGAVTSISGPTSGINGVTLNGGVLQLNAPTGNAGASFLQLNRSIQVAAQGGTIEVLLSSGAGLETVNGFTGTGTLTKAGLGQFFLLASNNFAGPIVLATNGGSFDIRSAGALTSADSITINPGANINVDNQNGIANGTSVLGSTNNQNRVADTIPILLNGGTIQYTGRNTAGQIREVFGSTSAPVTLNRGQSTINALGYTGNGTNSLGGEIQIGNLARTPMSASPTLSAGGTVNFGGTGTLGTAGSNGRIFIDRINGGAAPADNSIVGGWATVGAEFAGYTTASGVVPANATFAGNVAAIPGSSDATANVRLTTAGAIGGDLTINSINLTGTAAGSTDLTFTNGTTTGGDTLNLVSGGFLAASANRTIGSATARGQITAGGTASSGVSELFFHINGSTTTVHSVIIDNPNGAKVAVVKDQGGALALNQVANSYSGGTWIAGGGSISTGTGNDVAYLGSGPVFVNNANLSQNARGATTSIAGYTLVNNAEITLGNSGAYTATSDRYNLAGGTTMYANTGGFHSLTRVATPGDLTTGSTVYLAPDAILAYNLTNAAGQDVGTAPTQGTGALAILNLGTNADLYFAPNGGTQGNNNIVVVGAGTAYKGLSTDRNNNRAYQGTIKANSDFYLQGLVIPGANRQFGLGNSTGVTIVNTTSGPINAMVVGNVRINAGAAFASVGPTFPSNLTFVATPGSNFELEGTNALGSGGTPASNAKAIIQSGALFNIWPDRPIISGDVIMQGGSRFIADDDAVVGAAVTGGTSQGSIGGNGSITFQKDAVAHVNKANALSGTATLNWESGSIVRLEFSSPIGVSTRVGGGAIYELFANNRTIVGQARPETITVSGGGFTNDSSNRNLDASNGRINVGAGGMTVAATTNTVFGLNDDYDLGVNTLTIGSYRAIDGNPKWGYTPISGLQTTQVQLTSQGSKALAGSNINVIAGTQLRQNTSNSLPDLAQINLETGTSLSLGQNFQEFSGGLNGAGNVVSTDGNAKLATGYNGANTTFSGSFTANYDPGATQNASVVKIGSGRLTLTGTSNWNNSLTVNDGEVRLSTSSGKTNFGNNYINTGGTLTLDNGSSAVNDRLGGTAASHQLYMGGGTLSLIGNSGAAVTENTTQLRVDAGGNSLITFTPGAGMTLATPTLQGRSISTFILHGDKLGAAPGAGVSTFTATSSNLFGTAAAGNVTTGLRPDIISDTPSTGGTAPYGFVSQFNTTEGFRRLNDSTEYTTIFSPGISNSNNTQLASPVTIPAPAAASVAATDTQIRSLVLSSGATAISNNSGATQTNAMTRFRVESGGLIVQPGVSSTITTPYFDSGTIFYIHGYENLSVNGTFLGSGLVKSGPGSLALGDAAVPYLSGNISISGGAVTLGANNNSWFTNTGTNVNASSLYLTGGSLDIKGNSQIFNLLRSVNNPNTTTTGFVQDLPGMSGDLLNTGASANMMVLGNSGTFNGSISGPINLTKAGGGNLDLTNVNPFAGTVTLRGGSIQLRSRATMANVTSFDINSGTLFLDNQTGIVDPTTGLQNIDNRIRTNIPITLRDGVLELRGAPAEFSKQTIQSITMERSGNFINSNASNSGATELRITNLTRDTTKGPAIIVSFGGSNLGRLSPDAAVAGGVSMNQDSRIFITNLNSSTLTLDADPLQPATTTNGFIGGWAITNSDNFALYKQSSGVGGANLNGGTPIVNGVPTNNVYPSMANGNSSAATSTAFVTTALVDVNADSTLTAGDKVVGGIRLSGGALRQLLFTGGTATGGQLVNVESGAIIRSNNNNGFNLGTATARGRLTAGGNGTATGDVQNLYLYANQNSGNNNILNSVIVDNPNGDKVRFVKALSSSVDMTAFNTYTGGTYVNGGTLRLVPTSATNGTTNVVLPGDLTIQDNANVTEVNVDAISRTANLSIVGGGILNLSANTNDTNFLNSISFTNYGASRNPQVTVAAATTLKLTGNITSVNDTYAATPLIAAGSTTTSILDLQGAVRTFDVSGSSPIGLLVQPSIVNGGILKTGPGMLALAGAAGGFSDGITINGGAVRIDNAGAIGTSNTIVVNNGSALVLNNIATSSAAALPAGIIIQLNGSTLAPFNNQSFLNGEVDVTGNSTISVNDYYQKTTARNLTLNGILAGTGSLLVTASPVSGQNGTLTLTNSGNTYAGSITMEPNAIVTANSSAGTGNVLTTGPITMLGGTLNIRDNGFGSNDFITGYDNDITISGNATLNIAQSNANTNNTIQFGALNVGNAIATLSSGNGYLYTFAAATTVSSPNSTINNSAGVTIGVLNGTAGANLTKYGSGTLNVVSANGTFTGGTTVGQGVLRLAPAADATMLGQGPLEIKVGATLQTDPGTGVTITYNPASVVNDGLIHARSGATNFGSKFLGSSPSLGLQPFSAFVERFAKPSDVGEANFDTAPVADPHIMLENANNFLTPNPGPGKLGPGLPANGATPLNFNNNTIQARSGGYFTANTEQGAAYLGSITIGGSIPAGPVSFGTASDDGSALYVDVNGDHLFQASERIVSNLGPHGVVSQIGTVTLGAGSYDVVVAFYQGTGGGSIEARFAPGAGVAYVNQFVFNPGGSINPPGNIQVDDGASLTAGGFTASTVTLNGTSSLSITAASTNSSAIALVNTGTGTLNVGGTSASSNLLTVQTLNISANQTLTKTGPGTLFVDGPAAGAGTLTVSQGRLGGHGSIGARVNIASGAVLAPGNSPGVLSIAGPLALASGSTYAVELGGITPGNTSTNYDQTNVTGATGTPLTLTGALLDVRSFGPFQHSASSGDVFYILTQAGTTAAAGTFAGLPEGATLNFADGNGTARITYLANWTGDVGTSSLTGGNDVALYDVSAVPEPASIGAIGLAAVGLLARRRRRNG